MHSTSGGEEFLEKESNDGIAMRREEGGGGDGIAALCFSGHIPIRLPWTGAIRGGPMLRRFNAEGERRAKGPAVITERARPAQIRLRARNPERAD
ncbi:hypothetical protein MTO96_025372 [Rhipicephalus appendiculatus]